VRSRNIHANIPWAWELDGVRAPITKRPRGTPLNGKLEVAARATELLPEAPASRAQVDPEAVRDQLKRILASSAFNASKRCHTLLSHVVEATLIGQRESLKERMLGVEVFHRDPAYDTASDPVVRMAAGEVRKRLAQYYYDHAHAHEIRIELPAGSYVPIFYVNVTDSDKYETAIIPLSLDLETPATYVEPAVETVPAPPAVPEKTLKHANVVAVLLAMSLGLIFGALGVKLHPFSKTSAIDEFWRPFVSSSKTVLISVGQIYTTELHLSPNTAQNKLSQPLQIHTAQMGSIPVFVQEDAVALARISAALQSRNKAYLIRGGASTTFSDLKESPTILIGSYDNDWTIRLNDRLRYYFDADASSGLVWIADRQRPSEKFGAHIPGKGNGLHEAYALVSRFYDPTTEQMTLEVAGKGKAMLAAAEFVANPVYMEDFSKHAPPNWYNKNMQALIRTNVVGGSAGPPEIAATYFW
jgi:hypothetical protein